MCLSMDKRKKRIGIIGSAVMFVLLLLSLFYYWYVSPSDISELEVALKNQRLFLLLILTVSIAMPLLMSFEKSKVLNLCVALSFCLIAFLFFTDITYSTVTYLYFVPPTMSLIVLLVKRWVDKRTAESTDLTTMNETSPEASEPERQKVSDGGKLVFYMGKKRELQ